MSYATPFSLLSFHLPDHDDSVSERLTWPLAGSALLHAVVFVAFLSLRFGSSLEQSSGSYEVTLVTLPEISASPTPQAKARKAVKAAPQRKAVIPPGKAVRTTGSRSTVKPRAPKRVMDSLVSALDSVVVPKPQVQALPQKSAPVRPSAPAPVKQSPAVEMDVSPIQAPPQPPKLVVGKSKTPIPTPAPRVDLLAPKLKQAVGATVVPKKPEQVSKRVSPTVASERKQKQDEAPESPVIALPSRAPRLAAVAPPEMREKETPRQTVRKSSTVESLKKAIQSVRIPERSPKSKTPPPVKKAGPLVSETVPPAKAAEARNLQQRKFVSPSAPPLAELQDLVPSQPTVPVTASESDTAPRQEIEEVLIPDLLAFDTQPVSKQTESGAEKARGLWKAGLCSQNNSYWENVEEKIDNIHGKIYRYHYRVESPAILTFRVKRNGQVAGLDVVRSSGDKKFDLVAKRAVLAAAPLPPFPASMTKPFCQVQHEFKVKPN